MNTFFFNLNGLAFVLSIYRHHYTLAALNLVICLVFMADKIIEDIKK